LLCHRARAGGYADRDPFRPAQRNNASAEVKSTVKSIMIVVVFVQIWYSPAAAGEIDNLAVMADQIEDIFFMMDAARSSAPCLTQKA
jgi:hypothetical protein